MISPAFAHCNPTKLSQENSAPNIVGDIIDYENGEISALRFLELFGHLIRTGQVWSMQGSYGRTANALLEEGLLDGDGNLTDLALDRLADFPEED